MLYYLFKYLRENFHVSGAGLFQYITFRASLAIILSLIITLVFGKRLIRDLQKRQIGETIRNLGLQGETTKRGTPTMGGLIILTGILVPTILFARILNVYVIMILLSTVWLGLLGFLDDYIKVFKKNKEGLKGKYKIVGQVGLGLIIGLTMYYNKNVVTTREVVNGQPVLYSADERLVGQPYSHILNGKRKTFVQVQAPETTVPFTRNHELSFTKIGNLFGPDGSKIATPIIYCLFVIFVLTAVSNGVNLTDGLDGLATGTSAIAGITLGVFAYVSGNFIFADYLHIMYIPNLGELSIFIGALVGACIGFLWYNAYPAQVFMGDTGSLALGGIIAVLAIIIRKELLIPIFGGIFLVESLSVILQTAYFKYTKKKYREGRRIFLMAPLHHHYQKLGYHESKIVTRFWIIGIMLAVLSIVTMKIQ